MKPYSIDFREKVVKVYEEGNTSIRKLATRFDVSKAFVQRLLKQKKMKVFSLPASYRCSAECVSPKMSGLDR